METLQHAYSAVHYHAEAKKTLVHRFFSWCQAQEKSRLAWLAIMVTGHGCIITPLTLLFIMLSGNNVIFWPFAIASMTMALVVNLAALPTKITIPVFFLSLLIDLFVIVNCIVIGISA